MKYYTILDNNILISDSSEVLIQFYNDAKPLPEDYVKGKYIVEDGELVVNENYEAEQEQKEKERIQELSMTRSDFFDGTIMAWGIGQDELLVLIQGLLATLPIEDVKKLIAINNFKNALNFYRKHDLFKMLVNIPIQLTETIQIILTEESLDKFFDEVAKGNKETAWEYLPKPELIPVEEEIIPEPPVDNSEPVEEQEPLVDDIPDGEDVNNLEE
jgi:hypothetical protein